MTDRFRYREAIHHALSNDSELALMVVGIYDNPVQVGKPEKASDFPYITIGDDRIREWDDNCDTGGDVDSLIHVFSRTANRIETEAIIKHIWRILHRQIIPMIGAEIIGIDVNSTAAEREPDGKTIHGVVELSVKYRLTKPPTTLSLANIAMIV